MQVISFYKTNKKPKRKAAIEKSVVNILQRYFKDPAKLQEFVWFN